MEMFGCNIMEMFGSVAAMIFSSGQCLVVLRLHHRRIALHAVQLGQYFFEFPAD